MKGELRNIGGTTTSLVGVYGNSAVYPTSAVVKNPSAGTVYVGGQDVTTSTGFPLETDDAISIDMVNEGLWAVATVTTTVHVLRRGD